MGSLFEEFARANGLSFARGGQFPALSSALFMRSAVTHQIVGGELPGGAEGVVGEFEISSGSDHEEPPQQVILMSSRVPDAAAFLPILICQEAGLRGPLGMLLGPGGLIPVIRQYEFESIKLNRRYRIGLGRGGDENRLRQLFQPSFVDWLAESAPEGCFFELYSGMLSVVHQGEVADASELLDFCRFGSRVADRIRSEARESWDAGSAAAVVAPTPPATTSHDDELVARVRFDTPPASVASAARRYRGVARTEGRSWAIAGCLALVLGAALALILSMLVVFGGVWALAVAGAVGVGVAIYLFTKMLPSGFEARATELGLRAFLRGYAAQRGLEQRSAAAETLQVAPLQPPGKIVMALTGPAEAAPGTELLVLSNDSADEPAVAPALVVRCAALREAELRASPGVSPGAVTFGGVTVFAAADAVLGDYDRRSAEAVANLFGGRLRDRYTLSGAATADEERTLEPVAEWLAGLPAQVMAGFAAFRGSVLLFGPLAPTRDLDVPRLDAAVGELAALSRRLQPAAAPAA